MYDLSGLFVGTEQDFQAGLDAAKVAGTGPNLRVADLQKAIEFVGDYKKFLYGTDWPLAPMSAYRRLVEFLIPKEHHQEVFCSNAEAVFRIDGKGRRVGATPQG